MTTTLSSGCSKFTDDRGSSNCLKCRKISFTPIRTQLAIARPPCSIQNRSPRTMVYYNTGESASPPVLPKLRRVRASPVVVTNPGRGPIYLVTSVMSQEALSDAQVAVVYGKRWGIEVYYR